MAACQKPAAQTSIGFGRVKTLPYKGNSVGTGLPDGLFDPMPLRGRPVEDAGPYKERM